MNIPERKLWKELRDRRLNGLKFRRQVPIGPWVADFFCSEAALVIELDGEWSHRGPTLRRDRYRDEWMQDRGITVLRCSVSRLEKDKGSVLFEIQHTAQNRIVATLAQ